jgi:hypothetical protein
MNDPGYAALNVQFGEIQLLCDIAVVQTLTHCAIDRAPKRPFLPKSNALQISCFPPVSVASYQGRTTGAFCQTWSFVRFDLTNLRELTPEAEASVLLDRFR